MRLLLFPALIALLFCGFVALDINGSSVGALSAKGKPDPALIAGQPRVIRSDEFAISTPMAVGATRNGFPSEEWIGLTPTQLPATAYGGPAGDWTDTFKPFNWGYYLIGPSNGMTFHWWFGILISLIGVFALTRLLVRSDWLSAVAALVATFTPYCAWWSVTPALNLGFAALAGACAIKAGRATSWPKVLGWTVACTYFLLGLVLILYPPWIVSLGWVVAALVIGQYLDWRVPWRRVLAILAMVGGICGVVLVPWYFQNSAAFAAIANTYYPGGRQSGSGEMQWSMLLDAPASFWFAAPGIAIEAPNNLSEFASSWLPIPIAVVAVLCGLYFVRHRWAGAVVGGKTVEQQGRLTRSATPEPAAGKWSLIAVGAAGLLILAWAVLPVPHFIGDITLLSMAPGYRTQLALGFAAILLMIICAGLARGARMPGWLTITWCVAAVGTVASTFWAVRALPPNSSQISSVGLIATAACMTAGFALLAVGRWPRTVGALLAAYCFASWALVNPLYHGLGPLSTDPLVVATQEALRTEPDAVMANFGGSTRDALLQSTGVQPRSFTTFYPDPKLMSVIAPGPGQELLWNNYVNYLWVDDPDAHPAYLKNIQTTLDEFHIDPCSSEAKVLRITWFIADHPLRYSCLKQVDTIKRGTETVYRYRVR